MFIRSRILWARVIGIVLLLNVYVHDQVHATSWIRMEPEMVVQRAQLVVTGIYTFNDPTADQSSMWEGYNFTVSHVIKGYCPRMIIAGIDRDDQQGALDHQNAGGEYLLFLERDLDTNLMTPVGGTNGMVRIKDTKVQQQDDPHAQLYFTQYLAVHGIEAKLPKPSRQLDSTFSPLLLFVLVSVILTTLGWIIIQSRLTGSKKM
ncbi:hypothetical protein MH117_07510 [Paenibacillus sp. ACRRX]|uniref:hypothetical protein n=1 Tax=Paenibacillus sp. ACRRX TaxID=2918206 RepID=UPI001EF62CFB|nr:hypothetical protein [Paenibacillus sp. ACRRX]MCG7407262.1 hypothetical protein [Paenibacillus sp. ACRRX]